MTAFPKISKNLSHRSFIGASTLVPAALMPQVGEAHAAANTRAQLAAVHSGSPAHQLLCKTDEFFIVHPRCRQHEATAGASIDVHGHTFAELRQKVTTGQALNCKIVVNKNSFYYTVNGQYSSPINHSAYRGPYVHFGRSHGTNDGGPLELTRIEARQSWI
ncbi:hypothetical protein [Rothia sp. RSM386]|uniref:hypothetical protein n=1 Tax=Rothia sp. RSM386 TaxID=3030213 RepID=UPI00244B0B8A|nr:hypothetical protein [Rothia sp. RSM386]